MGCVETQTQKVSASYIKEYKFVLRCWGKNVEKHTFMLFSVDEYPATALNPKVAGVHNCEHFIGVDRVEKAYPRSQNHGCTCCHPLYIFCGMTAEKFPRGTADP